MSRQIISLSRIWQYKVVRFVCVGLINTFNDMVILNVLVFGFGLSLLPANVISVSCATSISYFLNQAIVFGRKHQHSLQRFLKFAAVTGLSVLAVQTAVIYAITHVVQASDIVSVLGVTDTQAKFLLINGTKALAVLSGMVWNYALYHLLVFRHANEPSAGKQVTF